MSLLSLGARKRAAALLLYTFGFDSIGTAQVRALPAASAPATPTSGSPLALPAAARVVTPESAEASHPAPRADRAASVGAALACPPALHLTADANGELPALELGQPTWAGRVLEHVANDAPATLAAGPTVVTWTVQSGTHGASCTQLVTVESAPAPVVQADVATASLWPPNHKFVDVGLQVLASDASGALPTVRIDVFADEAADAPTGDGNHSPDGSLTAGSLKLRSERAGDGDGRVYLVRATATNSAGASAWACRTVVVTHDQSEASIATVNAQAASAQGQCQATGAPPSGYFPVVGGAFAPGVPTVRPVLECVVNEGAGRRTAVFGYVNEAAIPATILLGADNMFTPAPLDRGQPTTFLQGTTPAGRAFAVTYEGTTLAWKLRGRTVTASSSTPACTTAPATPNAVDDVASTPLETPVAISVLQNDSDPQGDALRVLRSGAASHGTVALDAGGTVTYTPANGYTGADEFTYTVSDGNVGTDQARVSVTVIEGQPNQAPVVNAGLDRDLFLPEDVLTLTGSVSDDGRPAGASVSVSWTRVSGPAPVVFGSPGSAVTTASFTQAGSYLLRLSADDSQLTGSDTATVTVHPANHAPLVSAGADVSVQLPGSATLSGAVSDDGLPSGAALTSSWSQVSGPAAALFATPDSAVTAVSFPAPGEYVLRLTASDSQLVSFDDVVVTALAPPLPAISVADVTLAEGQSGWHDALVVLQLSGPAAQPITVFYATQAGGSASEGCDYRAAFGVASFDAGSLTASVPVAVLGDLAIEAHETLNVVLFDPSGATLANSTAQLTIQNDDTLNQAPGEIGGRVPGNQALELPREAPLAWSVQDPDSGDALAHDVYLGRSFSTDGQTWQPACAEGPSARDGAAAAFDAAGERLFVFGGETPTGPSAELWALSDATGRRAAFNWALVPAVAGPAPRKLATLGHDTQVGLLLAGGCSGTCDAPLADAWRFHDDGTGASWAELSPMPAGRAGHLASYDAGAQRLIVFGGRTPAGLDNATLVLRDPGGAAVWETLATAGEAPSPRWGAAGAYDASHDRLLIFGGFGADGAALDDVWVLTETLGAAQWQRLLPEDELKPAGRGFASAVFDDASGRLLVYGGTTAGVEAGTNVVAGDAWLLLGADGEVAPRWVRVQGEFAPEARFGAAVGYSPGQDRLVVALGSNNRLAAGAPADT